MTRTTMLLGLGLWLIEITFVVFMALATAVESNPLFWPVMIALLLILLPVDLYVAKRMPGNE